MNPKKEALLLQRLNAAVQEIEIQNKTDNIRPEGATAWRDMSSKLKKSKAIYESIYTYYKKFIILDVYERNTTGILTLFFLFFILVSYVFDLLKISIPPHYHTLEKIVVLLETFCRVYCAVIIIFYGLLCCYRYRSDSFRLMAKVLKKSWGEITKGIYPGIDLSNGDFRFRNINSTNSFNDLVTLTDLGIEAYGTSVIERYERLNKYTEWYDIRKDVFSFICDKDNTPIGFICLLPLCTERGELGNEHYEGGISQFKIDNSMIAKGKSDLLFLQGMYIKTKYTTAIPALITLLTSFYKKASDFTENNDYKARKTVIYAEPMTNQNNEMFKTIGFSFFRRYSESKTKIIELKFDKAITQNAWESILRIRSFKNSFTDDISFQ